MQRAKSLTFVHQDILTSPSQAYYILDEILISGELQVTSLSGGTISSSTSLMFFFLGGAPWRGKVAMTRLWFKWLRQSLWGVQQKSCSPSHLRTGADSCRGDWWEEKCSGSTVPGEKWSKMDKCCHIFLWKSKVWKQDQTSRFMPRLQTHKQE